MIAKLRYVSAVCVVCLLLRGVWKKEERRASVGGLELCLGMKGEEEEDLFA